MIDLHSEISKILLRFWIDKGYTNRIKNKEKEMYINAFLALIKKHEREALEEANTEKGILN